MRKKTKCSMVYLPVAGSVDHSTKIGYVKMVIEIPEELWIVAGEVDIPDGYIGPTIIHQLITRLYEDFVRKCISDQRRFTPNI